MVVDIRLTQERTVRDARQRRIRTVAAFACLMAFCLTTGPVFADELDAFLDRAEQSMRQSAESLRGKNAEKSVGSQSSAIRNLEEYLTYEQDRTMGDLQQDQ